MPLPALEREGETLYFLFEPRPRHPSNAITVHVMCDRRTIYEPGETAAAIQRAVNAHDDLVKALEAALATHGDQYSWGPIALAALAKAAS